METWNKLRLLRGRREQTDRKRLIKNLHAKNLMLIDTNHRVVKSWGRVETGWRGTMGD